MGSTAGKNLTTGSYNTIMGGYDAGSNLTTGSNNTFIGNGYYSGYSQLIDGVHYATPNTGSYNVGIGDNVLRFNTTGQGNVVSGYGAMGRRARTLCYWDLPRLDCLLGCNTKHGFI